MGRATGQKLKILYIMQMLLENTDENHAMSAAEIISKLNAYGIEAERKSVYDDIVNLQLFGVDIISRRSEPRGYYIASRDFELPELKLLVDAVQSSKFITEKKSKSLISKIEKLASHFEAKELQSQVVVSNRIKTMNESIYYNVDKLHSAISANVKICFKYCEWTVRKTLEPKKNGAFYSVSPWILTWDDENYYLIAYDDESGQIRHYRVDKMMNIRLKNEEREGREQFARFDIASFSRRTFGMFAGEERELKILFDNSLVGVVIDRFGKNVVIHKHDNKSFAAYIRVNISAQFYGWLAALGNGAKIVSPQKEADDYLSYIREISARYED